MELDFLHALQGIHNDTLDSIMLAITSLGDGGVLWIVTALLLLVIPAVGKEKKEHVKMRRLMGISMILSLLLNLICGNLIIKNLVQRPRPYQVDTSVIPLIYPSEYSFPSGHTSSSFTAACSIFLYHKRAGIAAFVVAAMIAFTRLYLFVHYPTDILGGIILGVVCAIIVRYAVKKYIEPKLFKETAL